MTSGGPTGQSGAIRVAVARALRSFVDIDMVEKMRIGIELPAKSDSYVLFSKLSGTLNLDLSIRVSLIELYTLVLYSAIVYI